MFTGVANQALAASVCPPSVNCNRVPFSFARPLNCKPVEVNPEAKLMLGEPILIGFNAATYAHELEAMSDSEIVTSAMGVLRTIYG